ncbi:MAG: Mut7-C RNAse domain-containing protein [Candidatus Cloacimonetes bacterium]|nr:Mut7-C RNAse domain-containing protein [Candidatus Cloacimonadota bacterium]
MMVDVNNNHKVKFLTDNNLGRLAKWLRLLGYDTSSYKKVSLLSLSNIARKEERIFLTSSRKNAGLKIFDNTILIHSSNIFEQLQELNAKLNLNFENAFTRCNLCNQLLRKIDKEKVVSLVPDYVYQTSDHFEICRNCGRIYWEGTHNQAILDKFKEIFITRDE